MSAPTRREQLGQIFRFALVGGVNTGTFYVIYLLLHPWLPYFAAYTLAFLLAMVGSFFMNTYFTYRTRPTWKKFLLFPLTNVTNYVIQSAGLYALVSWAGMDTRIARWSPRSWPSRSPSSSRARFSSRGRARNRPPNRSGPRRARRPGAENGGRGGHGTP